MSRSRTSRLARLLTIPALLFAGLAVPLATATPAQASTAPSLGSFDCDSMPARFFQLRVGDATNGYSELWMSSIVNPASSNPTFYNWSKVQDFAGPAKPVAIAAKSIKRSTNTANPGFVSYLYYSDTAAQLHQVRYASNENVPWRDDTLTTTGAFGFKALAWDGRLWGVKGASGDLYALTGLSAGGDNEWAPPTGANLVKSSFGFPKSFFGSTSSNAQIGFAEQTGEFKYATNGAKTTVAANYWNAGRTVDVGGGLLYRFLGGSTNEVRRYTIGDLDGLSTGIAPKGTNTNGLLVSNIVSADTPTTTVSSLCRKSVAVADQTRAGIIARAENWWDAQVPYDQGAYWGGGYRQDCSGFVSMAWQLGFSATTATLPQYSYQIDWSQLLPGDAILTNGHVMLFHSWVDAAKTKYNFIELASTADDMNRGVAYRGNGSDDRYYWPIRKNGL